MVRRGGALLHAAMLCATLSASTPALRAGTLASRRTVCPNSFNGSEEVDVFRTFLPPDEFDFVDLAPPPVPGAPATPAVSSSGTLPTR